MTFRPCYEPYCDEPGVKIIPVRIIGECRHHPQHRDGPDLCRVYEPALDRPADARHWACQEHADAATDLTRRLLAGKRRPITGRR